MTSAILDAARETLALGIYPVPVKAGTKKPVGTGWGEKRLTIDELAQYFSNGNGLGWLLGIKPRPIADVDLDCPEALRVTPLIAGPKTQRISGHKSNPASHCFYELPEECGSTKFQDPFRKKDEGKKMIVELRGKGGQTVVPPSIHHPSGEPYEWTKKGNFGTTTHSDLLRWVSKIAAASLLVRYWNARVSARLALIGMLCRAEWPEEETLEFIEAVIRIADPNDLREVKGNVANCYHRVEGGGEAFGQPTLKEVLGENGKLIVGTVAKWLGLKRGASTEPVPVGQMILSEGGGTKPLLANAITALRTSAEWQGVLWFNEFTLYPVARKPTPWPKPTGANWTDTDDLRAADWLQHQGIHVNPKIAADAVQIIAEENRFHPVKDYLNQLEWDGTERLDAWLSEYLGVTRNSFVRAVGPRWMMSAVARIFEPGCQADYVLLLEGEQGIKKSTSLRTLVPRPEWFTDHISDLDSKDSRLELHGVWIVELAELTSVRRSQVGRVKSFLTATSDHFRPPYGRRAIDVPRSNVFAGSVNDATPFVDETGNRRFWPVRCGKINVEALARDRDQLWAEALKRYRKGEARWLDTRALEHAAAKEQDARYEPGVWDELILAWLKAPTQREEWAGETEEKKKRKKIEPFNSDDDNVTITDILIHAVGKRIETCTQADRNQVARCLAHAGWTSGRRKKVDNLGFLRLYSRPGAKRKR